MAYLRHGCFGDPRKAPWKEQLFVASAREADVLLRMSAPRAGVACSMSVPPPDM